MRALVIDNYDSFTFNLVQLIGSLGARVEVRRNDACDLARLQEDPPAVIVISPGPGRPEGAGACVEVVRRCSGRIPILGVCLGHQAIALAFGCAILAAPKVQHGKTARIHHDRSALFVGVPVPFTATRYHSLVVDERTLDVGPLRVNARTASGLLMGLAHETHPTFGLQFHPESVLTSWGTRLVANFLAMAAAR